jgi:hypothetical protein
MSGWGLFPRQIVLFVELFYKPFSVNKFAFFWPSEERTAGLVFAEESRSTLYAAWGTARNSQRALFLAALFSSHVLNRKFIDKHRLALQGRRTVAVIAEASIGR